MLNLGPYKTLFVDRELRRIVLSSILPRLPAGINGFAITMMVESFYGSLSIGGLTTSAYLVAFGIMAPLLGRFVDQRGPKSVVVPFGIVHAIALLVLVFAAWQRVSVPLLLCCAAVVGLTFPPVSMTVRAMWRKSSFPDNTKQLGFALEGVIMETVFVSGPLIMSFFLLIKFPPGALIFSALTMVIGVWWFARSGALERWGDVEIAKRHWLGPLKMTGVRRALIVSMLLGATFGLQEFGIIAVARAAGADAMIGVLTAAYSVPSAIAGLMYGTRQYAWPLNRQMAIGHVWVALLSLLLGFSASLWLFGVLCFFCGMAVGPVITASQMQLGKLTPSEYSTEAFTWSMTLFMIALGGAFSIGGWLTENYGAGASMFCSAATALLGAMMCLRVPEIYAMPSAVV